jgi:peptidoglycan/LPS O-acetylase OafA/YrhL
MNNYRPDIDGLRAFSIIAVVVYHAFPTLLPGGFVGVDVFFVISGYLITGIILQGQAKAKFSIIEFYRRRIQRIIPALLLVLLFV